ncbi:DgyrCDS12226 [Dimorphilus gyrociliatus]|uniref:phosphoenolpyruvate mutase n=1 Tax=Dimorphilus gyrociliatus TaxID=2664684 RepID=A0A7I8W5X3_9ANNE|nr:DgyrCDS12226 [Dimorphilus gyrociliatus]
MNSILRFIPRNIPRLVSRAYATTIQEAAEPTPTPCASFYCHKTTALRRMLTSDKLEFLMEAHNGLSAKIVEEAGFCGIWASGLSMSAQLGVRDHNEASWTQVLEILEFMSDASDRPILVDADTGYGNFNNARRLVRKLEDRGIAGVCMEDKTFPKTNSLLEGVKQPLADPEEFALKIKACKEAQRDPDFSVVARVEAFIAGYGLEEALKRADQYHKAGADAILMHSKRSDHSEIEAFVTNWSNQSPVVIVPTKYYKTPTEQFRKWGISTVIWANHNLRSCITAMQNVCKTIKEEESLVNVESKVAPVKEVFRLQNEDQLLKDEEKFLPN